MPFQSTFFFFINLEKTASLTLKRVGAQYTEQNHLHGQRWEFCIRNNAQKTKENDVKMIFSSLAYIGRVEFTIGDQSCYSYRTVD